MEAALVVCWTYASLFLLLVVTNLLNPGQISAVMPEFAWVMLLLLPVYVVCAFMGTARDRLTAALLLVLPIPWVVYPLSGKLDRHRTEYYDTFAVMASAAFAALCAHLPPHSLQSPKQYFQLLS